jgi:hypothetical protein
MTPCRCTARTGDLFEHSPAARGSLTPRCRIMFDCVYGSQVCQAQAAVFSDAEWSARPARDQKRG